MSDREIRYAGRGIFATYWWIREVIDTRAEFPVVELYKVFRVR